MAVSNMPIGSSTERKRRHQPRHLRSQMSTYLLFPGMGDLKRMTAKAGPTELGVVTGKGNVGERRAASRWMPRRPFCHGITTISTVTLPARQCGRCPGQSQSLPAMENWGAIFTFERALLVESEIHVEAAGRRVYEIVAHEAAHQWFGNLVTMSWWDDLWLQRRLCQAGWPPR